MRAGEPKAWDSLARGPLLLVLVIFRCEAFSGQRARPLSQRKKRTAARLPDTRQWFQCQWKMSNSSRRDVSGMAATCSNNHVRATGETTASHASVLRNNCASADRGMKEMQLVRVLYAVHGIPINCAANTDRAGTRTTVPTADTLSAGRHRKGRRHQESKN